MVSGTLDHTDRHINRSIDWMLVLMNFFAAIYLVVVVLMSVLTFVVFGFDNRQALKGRGKRVPEKTIHVLALIGGWPGALAGQRVFRHKTIKMRFRIVLWLIIGMHLILLLIAIFNSQRMNSGISQCFNRSLSFFL